jgi:hypothetical protein
MSVAAVAQTAAQRCPASLWEEYQEHKKAHSKETARWRSQWEIVLYRPGETRDGKPLEEGGVFFRHKKCRHEYKPSNQPQTVKTHDCATVRDRRRAASCTSCRAG